MGTRIAAGCFGILCLLGSALSCSYDPEPVGCLFRLESTSLGKIANVYIANLDSLTSGDIALITAALDSSDCPVEMVVNISAWNNTAGDVVIEEFHWQAIGEMSSPEFLKSGELLYPVKVESGENVNIPIPLNFDAAAVLYDEYSAEEIIDLIWAFGGPGRLIRDSDHLGRLTLSVIVTESTDHGRIEQAGPFSVNLQWTQP